MTEQWTPIWVQRIDSEIKGYRDELSKHQKMAEGYESRIKELEAKRKTWTDTEARGDD